MRRDPSTSRPYSARGRSAARDRLGVDRYDRAQLALKCEALQPEFLFGDHGLPPGGALWRGPWEWVITRWSTLPLAVSLSQRGAHHIETMAVAAMSQAVRRAHRSLMETFDVAVIGAGIHGTGIAQAAAAPATRCCCSSRPRWPMAPRAAPAS